MLNVAAVTAHVTSAGVTATTDHVMAPPGYPSVTTLMLVPHSEFDSSSRSDSVVAPPVTAPHVGERSTAVWMRPPAQERKDGQAACRSKMGREEGRGQARTVDGAFLPPPPPPARRRTCPVRRFAEPAVGVV